MKGLGICKCNAITDTLLKMFKAWGFLKNIYKLPDSLRHFLLRVHNKDNDHFTVHWFLIFVPF